MLSTRAVGMFVQIKDVDALQNKLKKDYIITKELSTLAGNLALKCGRLLAVANTALITTKHIDFSATPTNSVVDKKWAELKVVDELPQQSSATAE